MPEIRKTLRDSLAPLQEVVADITGEEKKLTSEEAKLEKQKEGVCRSIQQSFDQLKAVLEQRKTELMEKANSLAQEKKKAIAAQKKVLQVAQKEVQLLMEFVERNVESMSDEDLMTIRTQLQTKVKEELKAKSVWGTAKLFICTYRRHYLQSSPPLMSFQIVLALYTAGMQHHNLFSITSCELGSQVQVSLCATNVSHPMYVSACLKSVADPSSSVEGEVVQNGENIFSIFITPKVRGRHDLIVKVEDTEIECSPLRMFVKFPSSRLRTKPVTLIGELNHPWGIALNNKQQFVLAERGKRVRVMERNGKKVQTIYCNQFQDPRGVAAASDGALYVTDVGAKCLFRFNSDGKLLKCVKNELQEPFSVKIIDNQLYVADHGRQLVKIFDMDCNVVGTIQTKECPCPYDVAKGPDGLYVADNEKVGVYKCAPNGVFIRHLDLEQRISWFRGLCFDASGNIIISCTGCCFLHVVNPNGDYIGPVVQSHAILDGCKSNGVAVDEDGFVYVCSDFTNQACIL